MTFTQGSTTKNKMMETNEIVLLYHIADKEKERKIKFLFVRLGVKIRNIHRDNYQSKIGALLNMEGYEMAPPYDGPDFEEEMMVLKGFSSSRLTMLLDAMKKEKARINLKAMITEHNINWTSLELYEELKKEHAEMNP